MQKNHVKKPSKRLNIEGWITIGLDYLRDEGPENLIIDTLCEKAGKTRGSFYFHFNTLDEFFEILIQNWLEQYTLSFTDRPIPQCNRLDLFYQLSSRLDVRLEAHIRRLACTNGVIEDTITIADGKRTTWLAELYQKTGHYDEAHAHSLSKIEYAAFVGFLMTDRDLSPQAAQALYQDFLALTNR